MNAKEMATDVRCAVDQAFDGIEHLFGDSDRVRIKRRIAARLARSVAQIEARIVRNLANRGRP
jgi:hypothetical protein